jgi:hypothetical protein
MVAMVMTVTHLAIPAMGVSVNFVVRAGGRRFFRIMGGGEIAMGVTSSNTVGVVRLTLVGHFIIGWVRRVRLVCVTIHW